MKPEVKAWIEELKQYRDIGRALDGKEDIPEPEQKNIPKEGIIILASLGLLILVFTIDLIAGSNVTPFLLALPAAWGVHKLAKKLHWKATPHKAPARPITIPQTPPQKRQTLTEIQRLEMACWILPLCCLTPILGFFFILPAYATAVITMTKGKLIPGIIALAIAPLAALTGTIIIAPLSTLFWVSIGRLIH